MTQDIDRPRLIGKNPISAGLPPGEATTDRIKWVKVSLIVLPLKNPVSDAKVLTGRQKPLVEVAFPYVEIATEQGYTGLGFSYCKRAGGPALFEHCREIADNLLGEDPNDIARLWDKLCWAGASVGRSGLAVQAIAAFDVALWDLKAKRAGLPLAKLFGAHRDSVQCYNTSGGFLSTPIEQVLENITKSLETGIKAIKIKVGQPDPMIDLARVEAVRKHIGDDISLMVDANQQWDRPTASRFGRILEQFNLIWIEEPLDAYDFEGHAQLAAQLDTPIATGEMLTSVAEHMELIRHNSCDFLMPDAPRIGGVTPFLKIMSFAEQKYLRLGPHFSMQLHHSLAAVYSLEPWVEHFDWMDDMFTEKLEVRDGRMIVPNRPGLGMALSDYGWSLKVVEAEFGKRP